LDEPMESMNLPLDASKQGPYVGPISREGRTVKLAEVRPESIEFSISTCYR